MMVRTYALRYHDISCGHRVVGHESKCRMLHGHNYRVHFECRAPDLDAIGRVIDFGVIKSTLCEWLEQHWDHRMLLWEEDPLLYFFSARKPYHMDTPTRIAEVEAALGGVHIVPFNPTAENMAKCLLTEVGPALLDGTGVTLTRVLIEETRKCSAAVELGDR